MKVIITGSTGLVGAAVIRECVSNDRFTHIFVLSRKSLTEDISKHPKVSVIIHNDFSTYPDNLLQRLDGCEACIWAIGGRAQQFPDIESYRRIQVDYTIAAAKAFIQHLTANLPEQKKFRFVFCSGKFAEFDQEKSLFFMADTRRIKGQVEKGLLDLAKNTDNRFDALCARPSGILPSDASFPSRLTGKLYSAIQVQDLAKALARLALNGNNTKIIESEDLIGI